MKKILFALLILAILVSCTPIELNNIPINRNLSQEQIDRNTFDKAVRDANIDLCKQIEGKCKLTYVDAPGYISKICEDGCINQIAKKLDQINPCLNNLNVDSYEFNVDGLQGYERDVFNNLSNYWRDECIFYFAQKNNNSELCNFVSKHGIKPYERIPDGVMHVTLNDFTQENCLDKLRYQNNFSLFNKLEYNSLDAYFIECEQYCGWGDPSCLDYKYKCYLSSQNKCLAYNKTFQNYCQLFLAANLANNYPDSAIELCNEIDASTVGNINKAACYKEIAYGLAPKDVPRALQYCDESTKYPFKDNFLSDYFYYCQCLESVVYLFKEGSGFMSNLSDYCERMPIQNCSDSYWRCKESADESEIKHNLNNIDKATEVCLRIYNTINLEPDYRERGLAEAQQCFYSIFRQTNFDPETIKKVCQSIPKDVNVDCHSD